MKLRLLIFLMLLPLISGFSEESDLLFEQGTQLYQAGQIEEALASFQQILNSDVEAGPVYYNMGNCYYKLGEIGLAIVHYERAMRLMPGNEDVRFNLGLANQVIVDQIEVHNDFILIRIWRGFLYLFSIPMFLVTLAGLYVMTVLFIIIRMLTRSGSVRFVFGRLAILSGIVLLILGLSYLARVQDSKNRVEAIILSEKVDVMSAPLTQGGTEVFVLHEGTKVRLDRERDEWVEIILPDRKVGWVKRGVLEVI
ncbi:tetratricopeptide repeat protein [candidate division KSB1 bacterium]|nr:tetratricopeptide repeat protein [candidate division KSB1 bacterium]